MKLTHTPLLHSQIHAKLITDEDAVHSVITLKAGNKTRLFCDYLWCPYEEIVSTDRELIDDAIAEHESLNDS